MSATTTPEGLCRRCARQPVADDADAFFDDRRLSDFLNDSNPAVAHVAGAAEGYRRDVEGWKRLAAAETDPARAEVYRKHGAIAAETSRALAQVAQDAKAVSRT